MDKEKDELVLEMNDTMYLHNWFLEIILGVVMFLLLYFDVGNKGIMDAFARVAIIYIVVGSVRKFYEYYIKKDKKIFFYKNKIERANKRLELGVENIDEIYKISSIYFIAYTKAKRFSSPIGILPVLLLAPLFIPLFAILNIALSFYYKKPSIQKYIVLIAGNDKEAIILPIPYHNKQQYDMLNDYLKVYLKTDIGTLKTQLFIPQKG